MITGCTFGPEDAPQPVPGPASTTLLTPGPAAEGSPRTEETTVYLIRGGRLSAAKRRSIGGPDSFTTSLQTLAGPPTGAERAAGLTSALPENASRLNWREETDRVIIALPEGFETLTVRRQLLALGQLVYTVTERRQIDAVSFALGDRSTDVPDDAGRLLARPVSRSDYRNIAPR